MNLFLDIETVPDQSTGALDRYLRDVKPPGQYKKQESIQKWIDENAEAVAVENWKKSALEGIAGEIISIAWAFDDKPVESVCRHIEEPEALCLDGFYAAIVRDTRPAQGKYPKIQWIGHNIIEFDLRFLWQRSVILNIRPPVKIPTESRHDNGRVFDTMKAWCGWKGYEKQDTIVSAIYDDSSLITDMDGSQVWELAAAGRLDELQEYNELDVIKARKLYEAMTWAR